MPIRLLAVNWRSRTSLLTRCRLAEPLLPDAADAPWAPPKVELLEPVERDPLEPAPVALDPVDPAPEEPDPVVEPEGRVVEPVEPLEPVEEELCAARLKGSAAATETIRRWRS